jgi:hypothetical protein
MFTCTFCKPNSSSLLLVIGKELGCWLQLPPGPTGAPLSGCATQHDNTPVNSNGAVGLMLQFSYAISCTAIIQYSGQMPQT